MRANPAALAALSAGALLVLTIAACGETPSPYLTSISGGTDQSTPENAVRGFFNELVKGDVRAAESYVDPSEQQAYAAAVQSAKQYSVQIKSFQVVAFDPSGSGGNVGVQVDGQTCVSGKCNPISSTADNSASIPVTSVNNIWYLTGVSAP